jgi:secondary thiamine-phosphate synthase enzyme
MRQLQRELSLETRGQGLYEMTREVAGVVADAKIETGLAHVFCRHTSCSLLIQENADPDVRRDLAAFFRRLVPDGDPLFTHTIEGPDDMPAHVKAALTQSTLTIPVANGVLALGTWQGVYVFEHRIEPHARRLIVHTIGE